MLICYKVIKTAIFLNEIWSYYECFSGVENNDTTN